MEIALGMLLGRLAQDGLVTVHRRCMMVSFEDVKLGDKLRADRGFPCIRDGAILEVMQNDLGELYVECDKGKHYLYGQRTAHGDLLGLTLVTENGDGIEKSTTR